MASFEDMTDAQKANVVQRATVLQKLLDNPEVSESVKRSIMKVDKSVKFSEIISKDEVTGVISDQTKKIEELEQKMIEESARANLERKKQQARDRGLDPEDVEKAITEKHIGTWETAMEHVEMSMQLARPTPASFSTGNSTEMPDDKEFQKNPEAWTAQRAHDVIDELRGRRAPLRAVK